MESFKHCEWNHYYYYYCCYLFYMQEAVLGGKYINFSAVSVHTWTMHNAIAAFGLCFIWVFVKSVQFSWWLQWWWKLSFTPITFKMKQRSILSINVSRKHDIMKDLKGDYRLAQRHHHNLKRCFITLAVYLQKELPECCACVWACCNNLWFF